MRNSLHVTAITVKVEETHLVIRVLRILMFTLNAPPLSTPQATGTYGCVFIYMWVLVKLQWDPQPSARPSPDQNTLPCLLWRCCLTWSASPLVFHHNSQWQQSTASAHTATHEPSQNTELCDSGGGEIEIWHKREGRRWQREKDRGQEDRNSKRKGQKGGGVGGYCHVYNLLSTIPLKNLLFFSSWF